MKLYCKNCNKEFNTTNAKKIYCSRLCRNEKRSLRYHSINNCIVGVSAGTVGAINELKVAIDLMKKGKEVFRALSPSCSCDLVVLEKNSIKRVEVRTGHYSGNGKLFYPYPKDGKADLWAVVVGDTIEYFNK